MYNQREEKNDYFGSTIFIVLFFLFIVSFSGNSDKAIIGKASQYKIASELHSNTNALNDAQYLFCQENLIPLIDKANFKLFNEELKIITDNRLINQRIIFLQKTELLIDPISISMFYHHIHYQDTEGPPILS